MEVQCLKNPKADYSILGFNYKPQLENCYVAA